MTLRAMSRLILLGSAAALGVALLIGFSSWRQIELNAERAEQVDRIYREYVRFKPRMEEAILAKRTPEAVQALRAQIDAFVRSGQPDADFESEVSSLLLELDGLFEQFYGELRARGPEDIPNSEELLRDENRLRLIDSRIQQALLRIEQASELRIRDVYEDTLVRLLIAVIALGLGGFFVGWTIYHRMRRPLDSLMDGVARLGQAADAEGQPIALERRDELGELAQALNSMSSRLTENRKELLEAVERFDQLAWTLEDLFWIFDGDRNAVVYLSPAFASLYGFEPDGEKLNPDYWLDHIPSDDHAAYKRFLAGWAEGYSEGLYRFHRPDGKVIWVQDKAFAITREGEPTGVMVGVARDVTKEVRMREDLRRRVAHQHTLYEASLIMHDSKQSVSSICLQLANLLPRLVDKSRNGSARVELAGEVFVSREWGNASLVMQAPVKALDRNEGKIVLGCRAVDRVVDGDEEGFRQSEQFALELIAANLSAEMNKRRMESRLWQDEKLKAVGELTGGIAHDFNNLLTVIIGNLEMALEDHAGDSSQRELLEMIMSASSQAADLTSRLLAYARRQPLEPEITNVNELLDDLLPMLERTLGENIRVALKKTPDPWLTRVDKTQLNASLLNLAINARDAMPEGGELIIETCNEKVSDYEADEFLDLAPGDFLVISVTDDGKGIPSDETERVFEPFYTTKSKSAGTGLGLSMVYGFSRQSGGNATIYSEVGIGTTVKLYLPHSRASSVESERTPSVDVDLKGRRVVLVEDDELVQSYVNRLLTGLGIEVHSCSNSAIALDYLRSGCDYDLLLTDVVMPGEIDGIELAEKARERDPNLPVLFMSGYTRERFSDRIAAGEEAVLLTKPFRREDLKNALHRVWPRALEASANESGPVQAREECRSAHE